MSPGMPLAASLFYCCRIRLQLSTLQLSHVRRQHHHRSRSRQRGRRVRQLPAREVHSARRAGRRRWRRRRQRDRRGRAGRRQSVGARASQALAGETGRAGRQLELSRRELRRPGDSRSAGHDGLRRQARSAAQRSGRAGRARHRGPRRQGRQRQHAIQVGHQPGPARLHAAAKKARAGICGSS